MTRGKDVVRQNEKVALSASLRESPATFAEAAHTHGLASLGLGQAAESLWAYTLRSSA